MLKKVYLSAPLAILAKYVFKLILLSCRIKVQGVAHLKNAIQSNSCLLAMWHGRIAMTCEFFRHYLPEQRYTAFLSSSRDGDPIAHMLKSYPLAQFIRVSRMKRHQALKEMIAVLKSRVDVIVVVTPDGPKGPPQKVKPGIVSAAMKAKVPIVPLDWKATRFWSINSWDRFCLPKPFSTIVIKLGPAIHISQECDFEAAVKRVEEALNHLSH